MPSLFASLAGWTVRRPAAVALVSLLVSPALAQVRPAPLPGQVRTSEGAAVPYATVTLHRAQDSVAVKTEFSDPEGHFQLTPAAVGRYLISVSQLGYARAWAGPLEAGTAAPAPLTITLRAMATALQGVTVTGQKPLFERQADRTVVNVENSRLAPGNTALDVLSRAPGVSLDGNDNLALRGKQGLLVLLDGKRVPVTGAELANLLRALPAEQLRTIELITNPPAKYDAQGGAGIIAINLKKDLRLGTNGSANASYGRGQYGKAGAGFSLNHRSSKLNLFGTYAYADRRGFQNLTFDRQYYQNGCLTTRSEQRNERRFELESHTWRAGLDYTVGKRTTLGAVASGLASQLPITGTSKSVFFDSTGQPVQAYTADNRSNVRTPNVAGNLSLRHTFPADSAGAAELSVDLDAARYGTDRNLALTTRYTVPRAVELPISGAQDGSLTIQSVKADYVLPLAQSLRFEAGGKASWVRSDNDYVFFNVVPDPSNGFRYDENINAGYLTLTRTRPELTLVAGLRAEQTNATGRQTSGTGNFERHYFQLFPNLSVTRTLSEMHEMSLSFSRRIDRPTYNQLNPFRFYVDPNTYRAGNPYLRPQTSYNVEFSQTFHKLTTGLSYAYTHLPSVDVYALDAAGLVQSTNANLHQQHSYALSLTAPLTPAKWWQLYANAELFYIYFNGTFGGSRTLPGQPGAVLSANNSFVPGHGWSADLSGSYHSREQYAFQVIRSYGQVAVGVQKTVLDGRGTLRLNATDLLYTAPVRSTARYVVLTETQRSTQDTRVVTASFAYRFGRNEIAAARKRASGAEDEKRRAAGQ